MGLVCKKCGFPNLLPPPCKLAGKLFGKICCKLSLRPTLVLTIAKEVDNETDCLLAELMIIVSFLKLTKNIQQLRRKEKLIVGIFLSLYFKTDSLDKLLKRTKRMMLFF